MKVGMGRPPNRTKELEKIYIQDGKLYLCIDGSGIRYLLARLILPKKYKIVEKVTEVR